MSMRGVCLAVSIASIAVGGIYIISMLADSSSVRTFPTYQDVMKTDLIQKGWVPEIIPNDAINITLWYDLDSSRVVLNYKFQTQIVRESDLVMLTDCSHSARCGDKAKKLRADLPISEGIRIYEVKGISENALLIVHENEKTAEYQAMLGSR